MSGCYPGLPATGLARSIFVIKVKICDGSVYLFMPVLPAMVSYFGFGPAVFLSPLVVLAYSSFAARETAAFCFCFFTLPMLPALRTK